MLFGFIDTNIFFILGVLAALSAANLSLMIYIGSKNYSSRVFAVGSLVAAIWMTSTAMYMNATDTLSNNFTELFFQYVPRLNYYLGLVIALVIFYTCYLFPDTKDTKNKMKWSIVLTSVALAPLFFMTDLILGNHVGWTTPILGIPTVQWYIGPLSLLYEIAFPGLILAGVFLLYGKSLQAEKKQRTQLRFMSLTLMLGGTPGALFGIILPSLGHPEFSILAPAAQILWIGLLAYSIVKYDQMNTKIVFTEVLIVAAIFILFISLFI